MSPETKPAPKTPLSKPGKGMEKVVKEAERKIKLAKDRLMGKQPFHAAVLGGMPVLPRIGIETMGVTFGPDCVLLLFEPDFVIQTPLRELVGVLLHEVHHVIFRHLEMNRTEYPNQRALIISQEVTVNEFVKEPLPKGVVLLEQYPDLPPMETTQERYRKLDKLYPMTTVKVKMKSGPGGPEGGGGVAPGTLDNHDYWDITIYPDDWPDDMKGEEGMTKEEKIEELLQGAADSLTEEQKRQVRSDESMAGTWGPGAGGILEKVTEAKRTNCWDLLRSYIGREVSIRPVFTRPPRRFPELLGVFPAYSRRPDKPHILVAVDTSGSITPRLMSITAANLRKLGKDYEITIAECDATIHRVYKFKTRLRDVVGGGGTDFRPLFEKSFLKKHQPDLIILFTDGFEPHPHQAPSVPTIWGILPGGVKPVKWGRVVYLK